VLSSATLPLQLGILIDTSASEREGGYFSEAVKTVKSFANESLRGAGDRVFFEPFSLKPTMGDWLSKEQVAEQSLQLNVRGGTAIYDAIAAACIERMGKADWRNRRSAYWC
jgi:hypothetical protein